jgi:dCMP deaminase
MKSGSKAIVVYVPAPHLGYLNLFRKYSDAVPYVLGDEYIAEHRPLVRHLPAIPPDNARVMLDAVHVSRHPVTVLTKSLAPSVRERYETIVMPDEDIMHRIADTYFEWHDMVFDDSIRLRWDWGATLAQKDPGGAVSIQEGDRYFMRLAAGSSTGSPDWWRQVGAVFVKDGTALITSNNQHMPHEQSAYLEGDPRSNFDPGEHLDMSLALHAEAAVVAEAARRGVAMEGGDLYVTTFPCPQCAYKVAATGIKRLFYVGGYTLLTGAETLQSRGVELIRVVL